MGFKFNPLTGKFDVTVKGSTNTFSTIQCPAGTNPAADSDTDTLTLTSTDSSITITGNSTTDTINFAVLGLKVNNGETVSVGVGAGAADDGTTNKNTFIGYGCGEDTTTGYTNFAGGHNCFNSNITGYQNTILGVDAIPTGTAPLNMVIAGFQAAFKGTTPANSVILGMYADYQNTSGARNVIVGYNAFRGVNQFARSNNIILGYQAGNNASGAGANNNIIIGYDIDLPDATAAYQLSIGNVIYGQIDKYNVGIGINTWGTNATHTLSLNADGTVPSDSPAGIVQIYADDSSDGAANATLALRTEQAVEAIGTFTASHKLKIWINGVEYWIQLDAV